MTRRRRTVSGRIYGPKVAAVMEFVEEMGNRGVICRLEDIVSALEGEVGTEIAKG